MSILDAAEKVIFAKGYDKASVDMIAREAELSKGTVYLYFKTKEDIYFMIAERGKEVLLKFLKQSGVKYKKGGDQVVAMAEAYLEFYKQEKKYFEAICYQESMELKVNYDDPFFQTCTLEDLFQVESPLTVFVNSLKLGITDGTIRPDVKVLETAFSVWSQATGVIQFMNARGQYVEAAFKLSPSQLWDNFMNLLKYSLAPMPMPISINN